METSAQQLVDALQQVRSQSEDQRVALLSQIRDLVFSGSVSQSSAAAILPFVALEISQDVSVTVRKCVVDLVFSALQMFPRLSTDLLPAVVVFLKDASFHVSRSVLVHAQTIVPFIYRFVLDHLSEGTGIIGILETLDVFIDESIMRLASEQQSLVLSSIRFLESLLSSSQFNITMLDSDADLEVALRQRVVAKFGHALNGLFTLINTRAGIAITPSSVTVGCAVVNVLSKIVRSPYSLCTESTELVLQCLIAVRDYTVAVVSGGDSSVLKSTSESMRHTTRSALISVVGRVFEITSSASSNLFITLKDSFAAVDAVDEFQAIRRRFMFSGTVDSSRQDVDPFSLSRKRDTSGASEHLGESTKRPKVPGHLQALGIAQELYATPVGSLSSMQIAERVVKNCTTRFSTLKPLPSHLKSRDGGQSVFAEFVNAVSNLASYCPALPVGTPSTMLYPTAGAASSANSTVDSALDPRLSNQMSSPGFSSSGISYMQPLFTTTVPLDVMDDDPLDMKDEASVSRRIEEKPRVPAHVPRTQHAQIATDDLSSDSAGDKIDGSAESGMNHYEQWMSEFTLRFADAQDVIKKSGKRKTLFVWVLRVLIRDLAVHLQHDVHLEIAQLRSLYHDPADASSLGVACPPLNRIFEISRLIAEALPSHSTEATSLCLAIYTANQMLSDRNRLCLYDFFVSSIVEHALKQLSGAPEATVLQWVNSLFVFTSSVVRFSPDVLSSLMRCVLQRNISEMCVLHFCELARLRTPLRLDIIERLLTYCCSGSAEEASSFLNRNTLIAVLIRELLGDPRFRSFIVEFGTRSFRGLASESAGEAEDPVVLEDIFIRQSGLFFEILVHQLSLLAELFDIYSALPKFQGFFRARLDSLGREKLTVIGRSQEFVRIIRDPLPGSEALVLHLLDLVCTVMAADVESVNKIAEAVRDAYAYRKYGVDILLPVLGYAAIPKAVVTESLPRLLLMKAGTFEMAVQRVLASASSGIYASDVLVLGHSLSMSHFPDSGIAEDGIVRLQMDFVNRCLGFRNFFTEKSIATSLQRMAEFPRIPILFMRTMIMALDRYPSLVDVCLSIMFRLIDRQIWTQPPLWTGFLKCLEKCKPRCVDVILRLPSAQFKETLTATPAFRTLIAESVDASQLTSFQQSVVYKR
eukprot:ANDGO_07893.mRNA.1 Symplekin